MAEYCIVCPNCKKRYSWSGEASPVPACPHCTNQDKGNVEEALAMAEEIQDLAEDLPPEGEEFGMSVSEKAAEIAANIETHDRVTQGQFDALENMLDGLRRWFHN